MADCVSPGKKACFIADERYRRHRYASNHPLAIPRVSLTQDLIRSYGAMCDDEFVQSKQASVEQLQWFHTADYVAAMQASEAAGKVMNQYRQRHNLGNFENPYFPGFFSTPATATGGSILAAEEMLKGRVAFSPAGGMHHAMPDQAHGFCFFNDPVLSILRLRQEGLRVLYLDIDAHHGDGVEYAFRDEPDVLTVSLHMGTDYAYPFKGGDWSDWGNLGNAVNLPLAKGSNDSEYQWVFERLWPRVLEAFQPQAVVLQAGTDMLLPDPLGKFQISTPLFLDVVAQIMELSPKHADGTAKLVVLGGGGYHPLALARCWTGVWGLLSGRQLPEALPAAGVDTLRQVDWDQDEDEDYFEQFFISRVEPRLPGDVREVVKTTLQQLLDQHPLWNSKA